MISDDSDERGIMEGPSDPDAQATVTDFIDYTEYLPSDLVRSLTLIRGLDETYLDAAASVHELTKIYGQLPNLPADSRPDPVVLRRQISEQLGRVMNARESAYAEACRLYDVVDRHFDRLGSIKSKLNALLKTCTAISRDESAPPLAESSLETKRERSGRKAGETRSTQRITLHIDGTRQVVAGSTVNETRPQNGKPQGVATRGPNHVLRNPDSPIASTEQSDDDLGPSSSHAAEAARSLDTSKNKGKSKKQKRVISRHISQPSDSSGNAEISQIDTSTSNALAMLKPPPDDAKIGSEHFPWLRLTEWEMTKLRKKMKKNNIWQPSEIMIHRELALRGRGWEGYRAAKLNAEATGAEFVDCDDITNNYVPGKLVRKSEVNADVSRVEETKLSNRGMKLNEAKKLKRENLAREQAALAAAEAEMAARRLGDIGSTFKSLFPSPAEQNLYNNVQSGLLGTSFKANGPAVKARPKVSKQTMKKRKFEETAVLESSQDVESPAPISLATVRPSTKKRKLSKSASTSAVNTAGDEFLVESASMGSFPPPHRLLLEQALDHVPPLEPLENRLAEIDLEGRAQPQQWPRPHLERINPPVQPQLVAVARRPAPGPVTSGQDGGAAVSVGRRKAKPVKKRKDQTMAPRTEDIRMDEDGFLEEIDPNEPRYCLCGDVSFGTMICCEDNDCDKEWFHLDCVGLSEVPSRTAKWYCPECRKKLGKALTDGIVRTGGGRRCP
ncbi:PHD finger domain-containing protein [Blastomyces dermatitidis ER-3]|uniref:Chromatin modification-related protein n=1 Tax=Ajellomyces dermatitidis (strain ER-3 / ATCC MYA-2586) TaxID=559297 RepID=A0ABX2VR58_AJEDR|nr:PHD finger domain-containing protein [Blastomyces dermatitidis ER-3]OAS99727.1 PHD finger domain-containing protein [Blastomyces dermatitidis ER-3]